ncbi:hypothetical protein [Haloarcula marina]|uniref:hypothetical protein n=1 Tax=Haloarcula marina TaxID=2961574 RepID=UPI0020B8172D|nr:hypothetical protein [Halomicroarcula marina]
MSFPYHLAPDGNAALPHHYYIGMGLAALLAAIVWDDHPKREPVAVMLAAVGGCFAFGSIWPRYPTVGATLALVANLTVVLAPFRPAWWSLWPRRYQVGVVLLGLLAADDVVQHALGWPMPIDWLWKHGGRDAVTGAFEVLASVA